MASIPVALGPAPDIAHLAHESQGADSRGEREATWEEWGVFTPSPRTSQNQVQKSHYPFLVFSTQIVATVVKIVILIYTTC